MSVEYTYTVTLEDVMHFGEHVYRRSDRVKRTKRAWCTITPLGFAVAAACYYWQVREVDWLVILIGGQAITSAVFLPRFFDRQSLKAVYREFIMRPEKSDAGSLRLIVEPDGLTEIGPARQTRRRWAEIQEIEESGGYLYVFDASRGAFIIPRRAFDDVRVYEDLKRNVFEYVQKRPA